MTQDQDMGAKLLAASIFGVLSMGEKGATAEEICDWIKTNKMDELAALVVNDGVESCEPINLGPRLTIVSGGKP